MAVVSSNRMSSRVRTLIAVALILSMLSLILNSYYVLMASHRPSGSVLDSPCQATAEVGKRPAKPSLAVVSVCIPGPRFSSEYINASLSNKQLFCDTWGAKCVLPSGDPYGQPTRVLLIFRKSMFPPYSSRLT